MSAGAVAVETVVCEVCGAEGPGLFLCGYDGRLSVLDALERSGYCCEAHRDELDRRLELRGPLAGPDHDEARRDERGIEDV